MSINVRPEVASMRMARMEADTVNGVATLKVKVPGTPGDLESRILSGGAGWFDNPQPGDYIIVHMVDDDNIMGQGVGAVVGTYTDDEVPADNQGWFINHHKKYIDIHQIAMFGVIPAGLYLRVMAYTADNRADKFRASIKWGKRA